MTSYFRQRMRRWQPLLLAAAAMTRRCQEVWLQPQWRAVAAVNRRHWNATRQNVGLACCRPLASTAVFTACWHVRASFLLPCLALAAGSMVRDPQC